MTDGLRTQLRVTVSGSFKRHLREIQESVAFFQARDVAVLSPADPTIVDQFGDFVFVSSDIRRSIKGIQSRHLAAIQSSDFLWVCCPDGYIGQSASMEIGFAVASGVPVLCDSAPSDLTLRQFCEVTGSLQNAFAVGFSRPTIAPTPNLLLAPAEAIAGVREQLDRLQEHLLVPSAHREDDPVETIAEAARSALTLHRHSSTPR
jgi:hypothetical protein